MSTKNNIILDLIKIAGDLEGVKDADLVDYLIIKHSKDTKDTKEPKDEWAIAGQDVEDLLDFIDGAKNEMSTSKKALMEFYKSMTMPKDEAEFKKQNKEFWKLTVSTMKSLQSVAMTIEKSLNKGYLETANDNNAVSQPTPEQKKPELPEVEENKPELEKKDEQSVVEQAKEKQDPKDKPKENKSWLQKAKQKWKENITDPYNEAYPQSKWD